MFCSSCGKFLDEGTQFCPQCGKKVGPAVSAAGETAQKSETCGVTQPKPPEQDPGKAAKRKKRAKIVWIGIAAIVVIAVVLGVVIPKVRYARKQASYNSAAALYAGGDYEAAREAFLALDDFGDAAGQAERCSQAMTYQQAMTLYQSGDYEAAAEKFGEADGFQDADTMKSECTQRTAYANAVALMKSGEYKTAEGVLASLDENLFPDKTALLTQCKEQVLEASRQADYQQAKQELADGHRSEAYRLFQGLDDYQDAAELAASCPEPQPDTGVMYENDAYSSDECSIGFQPQNNGTSAYIRLYSQSGDLAASLFINPGETASVDLAAGEYEIRVGYGFEWFGEEEMFGREGDYRQLLADNNSQYFKLDEQYGYTITLNATAGDGTPLSDQWISWDNF